jgi:hypothetical protein
MKRTDMQSYLHIGGGKDGLSFPATDDAETLEWQVGVTDKELYNLCFAKTPSGLYFQQLHQAARRS